MKRFVLAAALAASFAAFAQPPYGPGTGPGPGMGPGQGMGPGARGPRWGADNTPGWAMMTPEERKAHQEKMRAFKDPKECQAYVDEHHKQMEARAKERGKALPSRGPGPGCDYLKK